MKKVLAMLLILVLALGSAASAEEVRELRWEDAEEETGSIGGAFVTLEQAGFRIWIPDALKPVELTEEQIAKFGIAGFRAEEGVRAVSVMLYPLEEPGFTPEELAASCLEQPDKYAETEVLKINGLSAVRYVQLQNGFITVNYVIDGPNFVSFMFYPAADDEYVRLVDLITHSIQKTEQ